MSCNIIVVSSTHPFYHSAYVERDKQTERELLLLNILMNKSLVLAAPATFTTSLGLYKLNWERLPLNEPLDK